MQNSTIKFEEISTLRRSEKNPILTKAHIPYESELVFNAGVTKFQGKYVMAFRNDFGNTEAGFAAGNSLLETNIGLAFSSDGVTWEVSPTPCPSFVRNGFRRAYDPRLTVIDGRCYICFAVDGEPGISGGIVVTDDFERFELLHFTEPDNRNMVLFPEKINGQFVRLDRPFPVYSRGGGEFFDTWISRSPDCRYWGNHHRLLSHADISFCNSKVGPAAPPVKTPAGWLTTFHAVWILDKPELNAWEPQGWNKVYYGGIMLLDLEDPSKIRGICQQPLLAPTKDYELNGFRGSAIFPGGMILEESGEVKIYYGAADTVECLATAHVDNLIKACMEGAAVCL